MIVEAETSIEALEIAKRQWPEASGWSVQPVPYHPVPSHLTVFSLRRRINA
jgi:hypothetical protein